MIKTQTRKRMRKNTKKMNTATKPEFVPYGDEWTRDTMKLPKSDLVSLLKS